MKKEKIWGYLIWGDFTVHCGMAFDHEGTNDADAIVKKACTALIRAGVDTAKTAPDFCLINNCRGRFQTLSAKTGYAQKEADTIRHTLGMTVLFVSIYGSGEIGKMNDTSIAVGDGNSVSVLTITANPTTPANNFSEESPNQVHHFYVEPFANEQTKFYSINGQLLNRSALPVYQSAGGIIVQSSALKNAKLAHSVQK